jgi:hypothetical protein
MTPAMFSIKATLCPIAPANGARQTAVFAQMPLRLGLR